jgi:hypothetical protein
LRSFVAFVVFLASCLFLISCGGGSSSPNSPNGTQSNITAGNWSFAAKSSSSVSGATFFINGNLTQSGSSVSGSMQIINPFSIPGCFYPDPVPIVPFAGTFTGDTAVLTSPTIYGQVITVTVSGSGNTLNGTYSIAGGCVDKGTVAATYVPPLTGTWTGNFTNPDGSVIPGVSATLTLTQSATANGPSFPLSGTLTLEECPSLFPVPIPGPCQVFPAETFPGTSPENAFVIGNSVFISGGDAGGDQ